MSRQSSEPKRSRCVRSRQIGRLLPLKKDLLTCTGLRCCRFSMATRCRCGVLQRLADPELGVIERILTRLEHISLICSVWYSFFEDGGLLWIHHRRKKKEEKENPYSVEERIVQRFNTAAGSAAVISAASAGSSSSRVHM